MKQFEIYWHDLNEEAQERLKDLYHDNIDISPLAIIDVEDDGMRQVFGIYTSDVLVEDVHEVTTQPLVFFDTEEEAKREVENIVSTGRFTREELVIHPVWIPK